MNVDNFNNFQLSSFLSIKSHEYKPEHCGFTQASDKVFSSQHKIPTNSKMKGYKGTG
ncbi:uncharacterized protein LOC144432088 isoform X4 [Styela clava]